MADTPQAKPFDGGMTRFRERFAPKDVRNAAENARRDGVLNPSCPCGKSWARKKYEAMLYGFQFEPGKRRTWITTAGPCVVAAIEGCGGARMGDMIKRFRGFMNLRRARAATPGKPSERGLVQRFFRHPVLRFPDAGQIVSFDRSRAPLGVIPGNDTGRVRITAIRFLLGNAEYPDKNETIARSPGPNIFVGTRMFDA